MAAVQKITPFLWFDGNAEEAANYYVSIFPNSKVHYIKHTGEEGPGEPGSVLLVRFQLEGQEFMALNGGPEYSFTPAVSFLVSCKDQTEIDYLWEKLTDGGKEVACGWLTDRFGLSWQIAPEVFGELIGDSDPEKAGRVMKAMMQMVKLDIAKLYEAYNG